MKKEYENILKTRELELCISCEICLASCANKAIIMEYTKGQYIPKVITDKCNNCGLCIKLCPGIDLNLDSTGLNKHIECYTAYSNNIELRNKSTSGGLITNLIIEIISKKEYNASFILNFDIFKNTSARIKKIENIEDIYKAAKSKYIPASVYNVILEIKKKNNKKYLIVGTPCQINGIKKYIDEFKIDKGNLLFFGLFCDQTLNFNVIRYLEDTYKRGNEKLDKLDFRTKEKYGWPGNMKLYFDSGREQIVDREVRIKIKKYFKLNRCLFCIDKLNSLADICFGDCYIKGNSDIEGKSSVIIRTQEGKKIFDKYSYLFTLEKVDIEAIAESQNISNKKINQEWIDAYKSKSIANKTNRKAIKELRMQQKYVGWGMNYNIHKIKYDLFLTKIKNKCGLFGKIFIYTKALLFAFGKDLIINFGKKHYKESMDKKNIIIVGGELFNKGAQAMTFTVVDNMKRIYPEKHLYLFSQIDYERSETEKSKYNFKILPWEFKTRLLFLGSRNSQFKSDYKYINKEIQTILENAYCFIDISGFSLSSQFGFIAPINYLLNIVAARRYSIPFYILPQSMGPFNYPFIYKIFLYPLLRIYLKYPKKIFLRENEGYNLIKKFTNTNIKKGNDIVLQNKIYNIDNIFREMIKLRNVEIKNNSVGIIPNMRVLELKGKDIYIVYNSIIREVINKGKNVYLLRHSSEDLNMCQHIKKYFNEDKNIIIISDELNALELEKLIKKFDFIIASRYHSIVHAYKNGVPALVIGWAEKYVELLKTFKQQEYLFDCRNEIDMDEMKNKLNKMIESYLNEKTKILNEKKLIDKESPFDIFKGKQSSEEI